ncbi:MAG TPA: prephenate dehydrogenase/arogenate dehydrogenase family protein [Terracidiphilus sp.]|jgi:prephenate dehydrogenase|nr:prephenate dehydrogenase/arogenate dehydrogenase family protein [Terracidiphilus sp.]
MIERILIVGTGLLGASTGLALRAHGFAGEVIGWDRDTAMLQTALQRGALTSAADDPLHAAKDADLILLAGPVLAIVEWMGRLAEVLRPHQLVTDVGSTKQQITEAAAEHYNRPDRAGFLPGHPMAGKEVSGAPYADAELFRGAVWLFTPAAPFAPESMAAATAVEFRSLVEGFGCRTLEMNAARHDELLAWVSHLPQFLATALSALFQDEFGADADLRAIGGRALREMTRLGSSPYSMWRDVALSNPEHVEQALLALEQRLSHLRGILRTPALRDEFERANQFRAEALL